MFIQLNRPKQLNALNDGLYKEMLEAISMADRDPHIKCIILTGSEKAFAAGADIKEMKDMTFSTCYMSNMHLDRQNLALSRKPVIAAVNGYCLGGGCELAMMCDIIIAGENAKFGQPEINLGILPGNGGTQRLPRAVGKSKAMEMILTGDFITANNALLHGLISKVVKTSDTVTEATKMAQKIASKSLTAIILSKDSVRAAYETSLQDGLLYENRLFHASFSTQDQKEGMNAFVEKRKAKWSNC